jgi:hypothetical protein
MNSRTATTHRQRGPLQRRIGCALFLGYYFAMPSYLQRQVSLLCAYAVVCVLSLILALQVAEARAFALGLVFPGAGFLHWAGDGQALVAMAAALSALLLFALALLTWFATGNVLLPPLAWIGAAVAAAHPAWLGLQTGAVAPLWSVILPLALPAAGTMVMATMLLRRQAGRADREPALQPAVPMAPRDEIALDDLQRLRLLLDRALQPAERFDGFEWRDQFQTAAVRYQINFMSYALSAARANHLPAATAYLDEAQRRLIAKLGDKRVWGYWALENAWGNLRIERDPVPRDNIMFTGFVGLQMALSGTGAALALRDRRETWRRYALSELTDILAVQYRNAPSTLLACEPNWVYPLCNLITACGVLAADNADGRQRWSGIAEHFRAGLLREMTTRSGDFVAFRSSLTGIAPPSPGGAVMRAFPCLFLNATYPDLAEAHWERLRRSLAARDWRRTFWPIDVGNYGFSRASSYAASAAAAVEMGDGETAAALLGRLEDECPSRTIDGVTHRERTSLWAHALELLARLGRKDGLRTMVARATAERPAGPSLIGAPYPDVLIARATSDGTSLDLVLHPGSTATNALIAIAGLRPSHRYRTGPDAAPFLASEAGWAQLTVPLHGRTVLSVAPVA